MNDEIFVSKAARDSIHSEEELQNKLMSINASNVEELGDFLLHSDYVSSMEGLKLIAHVINRVALTRFDSLQSLARLSCILKSNYVQNNILSLLPEVYLKSDMNPAFIYQCHQYEMFTDSLIITLCNQTRSKTKKRELFCWFGPLLEHHNPMNFQKALKELRAKDKATDFNQLDHEFTRKFGFLYANRWAQHSEWTRIRYRPGSIAAIIKLDDIFELKKLVENESRFDVDQRIPTDTLEIIDLLKHNPTLLQFAAFHSAKQCFGYLITQGANYSITDDVGTPLSYFALAGGSDEIIGICREYQCDFTGATHIAAKFFRNELFQRIYENEDNDLNRTISDNNDSVFMQSLLAENLELVEFCIEHGCNPNEHNAQDFTPISIISHCNLYESVHLLASLKGININEVIDHKTPLQFAAEFGLVENVRVLLENEDIDVNAKTTNGMTALHIASANGRAEIVNLLLKHPNTDPNIQDKMLQTPLHKAATADQVEVMKVLSHDSRVKKDIEDIVYFFFIMFYYDFSCFIFIFKIPLLYTKYNLEPYNTLLAPPKNANCCIVY